ncbi:hypothetical protein PVAND_002555 [Polypedilum vanderplanki]|uniref:Uncharacterized protein n=1 Tax=Polypedilum vanderplanki TaxID=319348 RepID=A0A9J6BRR0_POLVA|nr:hypothetical protein PVAND_002555 [Polypedilum vanderplanki]
MLVKIVIFFALLGAFVVSSDVETDKDEILPISFANLNIRRVAGYASLIGAINFRFNLSLNGFYYPVIMPIVDSQHNYSLPITVPLHFYGFKGKITFS